MRTLLLFGLLILGACKKSGADGMLDDLEKLTDRMCACKDMACAQGVYRDLNSWKRSLPKDDPKMSTAEQEKFEKRADDLGTRLEGCLKTWKDQGPNTTFEG